MKDLTFTILQKKFYRKLNIDKKKYIKKNLKQNKRKQKKKNSLKRLTLRLQKKIIHRKEEDT
jgi:hypothetical protein